MKLFTIGDCVSQGFMSEAAARTDLSYATILADRLDENSYTFPTWEYGLPYDIDYILESYPERERWSFWKTLRKEIKAIL